MMKKKRDNDEKGKRSSDEIGRGETEKVCLRKLKVVY